MRFTQDVGAAHKEEQKKNPPRPPNFGQVAPTDQLWARGLGRPMTISDRRGRSRSRAEPTQLANGHLSNTAVGRYDGIPSLDRDPRWQVHLSPS